MRFDLPLTQACSWIDARLPDFRVNASPAWLFASIKAVTELAHAAEVLLRSDEPRYVAIGQRWMEFAWAEIKGGTQLCDLIARDPRLLPVGIAFLPFQLQGYSCAALHATIESQLRVAQLEPLGWTLVVPALRILGIAADATMEKRACELSVLANQTAADLVPQDAVYLLAHECLYATSWGRHAPIFDAHTAAYVATTLPALVDRYCALGDADVVAELILALHALALPCAVPRAWQTLQGAQTDSGNVVPSEPLHTLFPRLAHPLLQRTYHTTFVAIMAWSACRHSD